MTVFDVEPIRDFVGVNRVTITHFESFDHRGFVVHDAVKPPVTIVNISQPDVLSLTVLCEQFLHRKSVLRRSRVIKSGNELTHRFASLARRLIHLRVIILYLEDVRFAFGSDGGSTERVL